VSPDDKSVYAVSQEDNAIVRFNRDTSTGALTYQGCITGETQSGPSGSNACTQIATAASNGDNSGLDLLNGVTVSPDGKSVYVTSSGDDAVARFDRDTNGAVSYQGCITGQTDSGPSGSGACAQIGSAATEGANSGLDSPASPMVSPDSNGTSVYVSSANDDSVARFDRNTTTGALTYQGCITGRTESGPASPPPRSDACAEIPAAASSGTDSGLDSAAGLALSADGTSLYTATSLDDSVGRFDRNTTTGALTYQGCITGETQSGPTGSNACDQIGSAASSGGNSGLDQLSSVAVAADGASLYTLSTADDAAARFSRAASGALTYQGCISGETGSGGSCTLLPSAQLNTDSGLDNGNSILASADGRSLYAATSGDDSMVRFDREPVPPDSDGDGVPDSSDACPAEPGPASNGGCPLPTPPPPDTGGGGVTDTSAPSTTITAGPKAKTKKKTATFEFTSTEPGSTFECKLDDGSFQSCTSPHDVKVGKGKHTFEVRAKDAAGNVDPTPAQQSWTVKKKKKKK